MSSAIDSIPTGQQVEKGLVFSEYDSDGYPHKAEFVGSWTEIPNGFLYYAQARNGSYMARVTRLAIPDGVTRIGVGAFQNLAYITDIELPNNDFSVANVGFQNLGITQLYVKKNITILSTQAFDGFTKMTSAIFGGEVNAITNQCFRNANACMLYDFSNCSAIPPLYSTVSLGHANGCVIKVPSALFSTWQNETNWVDLTDVVWEAV